MVVMIVIMTVTMIVPMAMRMPVSMVVSVVVPVRMSMRVILGSASTDTFNMMMVTFLRQTNFCYSAQNLFSVFTELTVHHVGPIQDFLNAISKGIKNLRMI